VSYSLGTLTCSSHLAYIPFHSVATLLQCASLTFNEARSPLSPLQEVIPGPDILNSALLSHVRAPVDPTLAILDPLVPSGISKHKEYIPRNMDGRGFSSYTRETLVLLKLIAEDRQLGTANLWTLRHIIALGMFAADFLAVPSVSNPLFGPTSDKSELERIVQQVQQVTAYLTSSISNELSDEWHASTTKAILAETPSRAMAESAQIVIDVVTECRQSEGVQYSRILKTLLQGLLRGASNTSLDSWLALAQEFQKTGGYFLYVACALQCLTIYTALQTSLAILRTVASFSLDSQRADRYRNELASRISGVPPSRAKTEGLRLLRKLTVAAPPSDSDTVFLPQQRAIFLLQNIQKWITGDEENEGEIEEQIADLLFHLAPIIQNVPGSHWDFAFDLIEFNLEVSLTSACFVPLLMFRHRLPPWA
jgi:E3 ubiquitin-protein ligase listerin